MSKATKVPTMSDTQPFLDWKKELQIWCDDLPIVFTHIVDLEGEDRLAYGYADDRLTVPFQPGSICMLPESGRVYHPAPDKVGGVGLVKSALAIDLSQYFEYKDGDDDTQPPARFHWKGKAHELDNKLVDTVASASSLI